MNNQQDKARSGMLVGMLIGSLAGLVLGALLSSLAGRRVAKNWPQPAGSKKKVNQVDPRWLLQ